MRASDKEMAPREGWSSPGPGPQKRRETVDTMKSSAPDAHPSRPEVAAGDPFAYAGRKCFACYEGLVYIGHLEMAEEGEEVEVIEAVPCRRCNA